LRFASLGSGSEGNALLVETHDASGPFRILVDCGFGLKEAERRLRALGCEPESIGAILVTHEHGDHIGGVFRLAAAHSIPVYLSHGTLQACSPSGSVNERVRLLDPHLPVDLGGFRVEPIAVPHDAREPVQFVLDDGRVRLGVLTDLGHGSAHVIGALARLDALVLETNHDAGMLAANPHYPDSLKRRIGGRWGHLSNAEAARILAAIDQRRLKRVIAAHLSQHNNRADLARSALAGALGATPADIQVADQAIGLAWMEV
jgi:phosphoribosyl 1,2-cyclic phosphodiesterase